MSKFVINSLVSVGKINFGDSRDNVRKEFGDYKEFKKSRFSKNTTDGFNGFHVYYTQDNKVQAVEFFKEADLEFNGKKLFTMDYSEFDFKDESIIKDNSSITYKTLGFSVYSPSNSEVESILVFAKGYYD